MNIDTRQCMRVAQRVLQYNDKRTRASAHRTIAELCVAYDRMVEEWREDKLLRPISLTPEGNQTWRTLCHYIRQNHGIAPTLSELGKLLGLKAKSGVSRRLNLLEQRRYIVRDRRKTRGIQVLVWPEDILE